VAWEKRDAFKNSLVLHMAAKSLMLSTGKQEKL
jgi:hypothetical protein